MECVICYDLIGDTNKCVTPCGHNFCFNCIMKATQYNSKCPYCRNELREETTNIVNNDEDSHDEYSDEEDSNDDETTLISNMEPLTMDDLTIDDKNTGTYDNNGYYKYPLIIETLEQLYYTLRKCIPEGYTKQFKDTYDDDMSNERFASIYYLITCIKTKIPNFNYADMSNDHINMEYIQYVEQEYKSHTKCYEIFKRTRLIMKVNDSKRHNIYNRIRYEMADSRTQTEEFNVIRANDNEHTIRNILS